jgi:hypothetical protein
MHHTTTSGTASLAKWSSSSSARSFGTELLLLLAVGALAAVAHDLVRWPIKLPGHHGLEWLALLTAARLSSSRRGAAFTVACGAALTAIVVHGGPEAVLRPAIYLAQGAAMDALVLLTGGAGGALAWVLRGGVVHALSPAIKWAIAGSGAFQFHFGSLAHGATLPLLTHLTFGAIGAGAGLLGVEAFERLRRRRPRR